MSRRYKGGVISATAPTTSTSTAAGVWTQQSLAQAVSAGTWPRSPGAPTIGTATATGQTTATVAYTAPTDAGTGSVTYTATSTPGSLTGTGASPITVSGLTSATAYTFTVKGATPGGAGPASAASNSVTTASDYTTFTSGSFVNVYDPTGYGYDAKIVSCAMSATRVLYVMRSKASSKSGTEVVAVVLDISGTSITVNSSTVLSVSTNANIYGLTPLDSTYALLSNGNDGLRLIKITGSTAQAVGSSLFGGGMSNSVGAVHGLINSTQALVAVADYVNGTVRAAVVTRSGDTISSGGLSSVSTSGLTAAQGYAFTAACGSSTTAAVQYNNRLYPVTISGTTATISGSYVTATESGNNNVSGLSFVSNNLYLVTSNRSAGDRVSAQTMSQSGTTLTLNTATALSFDAGSVPAYSINRMYYGSTTAAVARGQNGIFTLNISGTTVSSTKTNALSLLSECWPAPVTSSQVMIPSYDGTNFRANISTAS
jgi:hypothetical protein